MGLNKLIKKPSKLKITRNTRKPKNIEVLRPNDMKYLRLFNSLFVFNFATKGVVPYAKKIKIEVPFKDLKDSSKWISGWIEIINENS